MKNARHHKAKPATESRKTGVDDTVSSDIVSDSGSEWISNEFSITPDDYRRMEARRRLELRRDEALLRAQIDDFF